MIMYQVEFKLVTCVGTCTQLGAMVDVSYDIYMRCIKTQYVEHGTVVDLVL